MKALYTADRTINNAMGAAAAAVPSLKTLSGRDGSHATA
jgi:hypothetical protein